MHRPSRTFYRDEFTPPFRAQAVGWGCTCRWWGEASIVEFDPECPLEYFRMHRHANDRFEPTRRDD